MSTLAVILVALAGLALLEPTEQQTERSASGRGHLTERLALLRELGLVRH